MSLLSIFSSAHLEDHFCSEWSEERLDRERLEETLIFASDLCRPGCHAALFFSNVQLSARCFHTSMLDSDKIHKSPRPCMTISVTQPRDSDDVSPYCSTGEYSGIRAVARADSGDGIGARVRSFNDKASLHQSTLGPASPITELTNRNQIFTEPSHIGIQNTTCRCTGSRYDIFLRILVVMFVLQYRNGTKSEISSAGFICTLSPFLLQHTAEMMSSPSHLIQKN